MHRSRGAERLEIDNHSSRPGDCEQHPAYRSGFMNSSTSLVASAFFFVLIPGGCSKGDSERVPTDPSSGTGQNSIDPAQVVGTWEFGRLGFTVRQNYFDDGTFRMDFPAGDNATGTWKLDGNTLFVTITDAGETDTLEIELVRVDESTMVQVGKDDDGARLENTWVRTN